MSARILLLALAIAVGIEDFRCHFTIRFTHSHAYDPSVKHTHPEIFGLLADDMEMPPFPTNPDPKEHSHLVRISQEVPSTEAATARMLFVPPMRRHGWRDNVSLSGPSRYGDPLFRPPC